jgi:hypothetical protein
MFHCERCGSSFNPLRAAALGFCPRCQGRDGVAAPLNFKLFAAGAAEDRSGPGSAVPEELVEGGAAEHRPRPLGDHV